MKNFLFVLVFSLFGLLNLSASPVSTIRMNLPNNIISTIKLLPLSMSGDSILFNNNKYLPINRYLELENDQKDFFYDIHNDLNDSFKKLAIEKENGIDKFKMHLYHDLRLSKMILEDKQYKKYLRIINVTLNNKNLMQYLLKDKIEG